MKKALIIAVVVLQADISTVITEVKSMQKFTPKFENIAKYNIFSEDIILNTQINTNKTTNKKFKLNLNAIFQNKANINGKWIKKGESIKGYKLIKISDNGIVLKRDKKLLPIVIKLNVLKVKK